MYKFDKSLYIITLYRTNGLMRREDTTLYILYNNMKIFSYNNANLFGMIEILHRRQIYLLSITTKSDDQNRLQHSIAPFLRFLPESPRWLLLKEKNKEVHKIIEKMAKMNKSRLPEGWQVVCTDVSVILRVVFI